MKCNICLQPLKPGQPCESEFCQDDEAKAQFAKALQAENPDENFGYYPCFGCGCIMEDAGARLSWYVLWERAQVDYQPEDAGQCCCSKCAEAYTIQWAAKCLSTYYNLDIGGVGSLFQKRVGKVLKNLERYGRLT